MKLRHDFLGLLLTLGLGLTGAQAENYQGASAILSALEKIENDATAKAEEKKDSKPEVLVAFEELRAKVATLSDEEAAKAWLAAHQKLLSLPPEEQRAFQNREWSESLRRNMQLVLPKSGAWKLIKAEVLQRAKADPKDTQALALRYYMAVLTLDFADKAACEEALLVILSQRKDIPGEYQEHFKKQFEQSTQQMKALSADPQALVEAFEQNLQKSLHPDPKDEERQYHTLEVPSLVKWVGTERAEAYLKEVLKVKGQVQLRGEKELELAKALVLKDPEALAAPRWDWINSLKDAALYEAMVKRFGAAEGDEEVQRLRSDAEQVYVAILIANGRTDEALARVIKQDDSKPPVGVDSHLFAELRKQGYEKQVYEFYHRVASARPELDIWGSLIETAASQHKTPEVLSLLKEKLPMLPPAQQQALRPFLYQALLANEDVEEGIKVLRELLANPEPFFAPLEETNHADPVLSVRFSDYSSHANRLVKLGELLQREDLKKEGLEGVRKSVVQSTKGDENSTWLDTSDLALLAKHGQGVWVENFVKERLEAELTKAKKEQGEHWADSYAYKAQDLQTVLLRVYHQAGRYQEMLTLLDESKYWGEDALDHLNVSYHSMPIQQLAVEALIQEGRKRDAEAMVLKSLRQGSSSDRWYEWLLQLKGQDALPILDELYARDAFEERPLIWKAKLLLEAGKVEEAERTVKAAIAIDPSDGETGKNDRMRVYQVLGEIHKKKGEAEQAKTMEGVIAAIRMSENADDYWEAGLLSRAVGMYEQSLKHFADAYCIESRLALRYREMNLPEKAAVHYRRAFELMPDSFGRIESHCFGCEGAFKGDQAEKIAEEVFEKLALEQPKKAQVFYLLGYLRESQKRNEEAAASYRRAIQLDPQYLNAFKKLVGLSEEIGMSTEEQEDLASRWFQLDPYDRNGGGQAFRSIKSTAKAWDLALVAQNRFEDQIPEPAYVLKATRAFKEERQKARGESAAYMSHRQEVSPKDRFLGEVHSRLSVISMAEQAFRTATQLMPRK